MLLYWTMREDVARMKIDSSVKRETLRVAGGICVLSGLMLFVFIVLGKLDMTVIFGTLLGTFNAILNFFLLAISVQKAADSMQGVVLPPEEDEENGNEKPEKQEAPEVTQAKTKLRFSYTGRMLLTGGLAVLGVLCPVFHSLAAVLPVLFIRPVISLLRILDAKKGA